MKQRILSALFGVLLLLLSSGLAQAEVDLPQMFSNHMVLQRHRAIPVWGEADPGQRVTVTIDNHSSSTTANDDRHWRVDLPPMKAGGPYKLTIEGSNRIVINDVLVGEVWVCSGQSNMAWALTNTHEAKKNNAVKKALFERIRLFQLPLMTSKTPLNRFKKTVKWTQVKPETAQVFSAVGYFFGRRLHQILKKRNGESEAVPIGLIQSTCGGSKAEAWTSRSALKTHPQLHALVQQIQSVKKIQKTPTLLYNAMIHPLIPFAIRGTIWYQGEANMEKPYQYRTLFPTMIRDWRDRWGQGDFPFYFAQIAPYEYGDRGSLPLLWESQLWTHRLLPRTGIAIINDHGNPNDIHPRTKKPVGERLARWALQQIYDRSVVPSGPLFKRLSIKKNRAVVYFNHTGEGLKIRSGTKLSQFKIAGPDRTFHPADAEIDGDTVIVRSDDVRHPVAVRYAWSDTAKANLLNSEGLPASSFRTDGWAVSK